MATRAATLINQLMARGYNQSDIARSIGRDSAVISHILSGKRTGDAYVPALETLVSSPSITPVPVERRKTKAGGLAKTRVGAIRDEKGRVINTITQSPDGVQMKRTLQQIQRANGSIGVVVSYRHYQAYEMNKPQHMDVPIWSKGASAKWILNRMQTQGVTFSELIQENVENAYKPEMADGIDNLTINVIYKS